MERAGVSRSVAMKLSGHKTESVYARYRIVDETDLREALTRVEAHVASDRARTVEECGQHCIEDIEGILKTHAHEVAGLIVEPLIQGFVCCRQGIHTFLLWFSLTACLAAVELLHHRRIHSGSHFVL